ncbi:MAG: hypothetical protein KDD10_28825 [Phaeodactylibacter sp.]|nr:hypothetical protein [Phaeodactylibacter sp.]MCB9292758.1 hypothetical protein [Lewinellaceae bacterium]
MSGKDFTLGTYKQLLDALSENGYFFQTFEQFADGNEGGKVAVLRHDVDRIPSNALKMARIEQERGLKATYFFRVVPSVWDERIIGKVTALGHEVAYHYEDLTITRGDHEKAIKHFAAQLRRLRKFYPSKTICMHGSPMTRWDNRKLWEYYDYRDFGIIAEPYFDVDFSKVFYITDTGRAWNNSQVSVRDKVHSGFDIPIKSTAHLIQLLAEGRLPPQVMINTHPHRWFEPGFGWYQELILQNLKNIVKFFLVKRKTDG